MAVSMGDIFVGEGGAFVMGSACTGEFAGLCVAHRARDGGWERD